MGSASVEDVRACLRFYSRLPAGLGANDHAMPDFSNVSWAAPVAGGIIGAIGAAVILALSLFHAPPPVAAVFAIGAVIFSTGALHEDGLADVADGFGGAVARERKLEIMRDSRHGTYGVLALVLSTLLRAASVSAILSQGAALAALSIVAASAMSRAVGLIPLATLPPARGDGAGASAARPSMSSMRTALAIGAILALAPVLAGATLAQAVVAILAAFAGAVGMARLAERQIGGYTGDVLGAAQQVAEIAMLICLSA
jgi:adenosylcobinamide-GDP ribazoletransferase